MAGLGGLRGVAEDGGCEGEVFEDGGFEDGVPETVVPGYVVSKHIVPGLIPEYIVLRK